MKKRVIALMIVASAALAGACAKTEKAPAADTSQAAPSTSPVSVTPGPGGKIIVIVATSDEKGNYFTPSEVEAHTGDVLRITLKTGVHNFHFLPDSNAGKSGLPAASEMLQLPGQTTDILVNFAPGSYYFQCDPHAALGMKGHLKVENESH